MTATVARIVNLPGTRPGHRSVLWLALLFLLLCNLQSLTFAQVRFTHGTLEVPTYTISRSETVAPLFKSADSAALYPYARLDRDAIQPKPVPVRYETLTLENEYLRVVILPELGGRKRLESAACPVFALMDFEGH